MLKFVLKISLNFGKNNELNKKKEEKIYCIFFLIIIKIQILDIPTNRMILISLWTVLFQKNI